MTPNAQMILNNQDILKILTSLIGLLVAGNLFWIMRLITKIDGVEKLIATKIPTHDEKLTQLERKVDGMNSQMREVVDASHALRNELGLLQVIFDERQVNRQSPKRFGRGQGY